MITFTNLLVVQNFHLNPLHGHSENTKRPPALAATLLTIYQRIGRAGSQSENGIRDSTLVDLY